MYDQLLAPRQPSRRPTRRPDHPPGAAVRPPARRHSPGAARVAAGLAGAFVVLMIVQVGHTFEHTLQLIHWVGNPIKIYMTPWAVWAAQGLADIFAGGYYMAGMELLHLIGNVLFQLGIVVGLVIAHRRLLPARRLRQAAWLQGAHVLEHVLLTVTVLTTGTALGISSLFGVLTPMTLEWIAVRVLFHFAINMVAFGLAIAGTPRPLRDPAARGRHERTQQGSWVRAPQPVAAMRRVLEPVPPLQPESSWQPRPARVYRHPAAGHPR